MPLSDIVRNSDIAKRPEGGVPMKDNCGCKPEVKPEGYWMNWIPGCPPPPMPDYPYPCPPVNPGVNSTEAKIAKLSKKAATIRKMIDNLVNKNKSIVISIGCGCNYNFGEYMNKEEEETEYGKAVLEMLQTELDAIKAKIIELTNELEVETLALDIEDTVLH